MLSSSGAGTGFSTAKYREVPRYLFLHAREKRERRERERERERERGEKKRESAIESTAVLRGTTRYYAGAAA